MLVGVGVIKAMLDAGGAPFAVKLLAEALGVDWCICHHFKHARDRERTLTGRACQAAAFSFCRFLGLAL